MRSYTGGIGRGSGVGDGSGVGGTGKGGSGAGFGGVGARHWASIMVSPPTSSLHRTVTGGSTTCLCLLQGGTALPVSGSCPARRAEAFRVHRACGASSTGGTFSDCPWSGVGTAGVPG